MTSTALPAIMLLLGGFDGFRVIEVAPPGQPVLTIRKIEDHNLTVTIGTMLTFSFTASLSTRSGLVLSSHTWTDNLDTLLRRRGYIESAIKFHLKSK